MTAFIPPSAAELAGRRERLIAALNQLENTWDAAVITDRINLYYLTGTIEDGVFMLKSSGEYGFFVRKSIERAKDESPLERLYPMRSYRDVAEVFGASFRTLLFESETTTVAALERLKKYIDCAKLCPLDFALKALRAQKSEYELQCVRASGERHALLMNERIPQLLKVGISEAEFSAAVYLEMVKLGHHGVSRYARIGSEVMGGQFAFGVNSLYPTCFDGPAGHKGLYAAAPVLGEQDRFLCEGDLVFADVSFGFGGYHTDKTQVYYMGKTVPKALSDAQNECIKVLDTLSSSLKIGAVPSELYRAVYDKIPQERRENFMGYGKNTVKFLGHGVGLHVDEYPVIAAGFDMPLPPGTVMAVEPKRAIPGVGLVGVEETFLITASGGECLTGGRRSIIPIG